MTLLLLSCASGRRRLRDAGGDATRPSGPPSEDGRLTARPAEPGMAAEAPAGVRSLELGEGGTALLYVPAG